MKAFALVWNLTSMMLLDFLGSFYVARAENQTLLMNAQVSTMYTDTSSTGNPNSVIGPGFKSFVLIRSSDPKGDGSNDQEVQIDLGASYQVASVFIGILQTNLDRSGRLGSSYIFVGEDNTPFSDNLTLATKEPFHSGGFIDLDFVVKGRYVVIRRIGPGFHGENAYTFSSIKIYAITNLLQ